PGDQDELAPRCPQPLQSASRRVLNAAVACHGAVVIASENRVSHGSGSQVRILDFGLQVFDAAPFNLQSTSQIMGSTRTIHPVGRDHGILSLMTNEAIGGPVPFAERG